MTGKFGRLSLSLAAKSSPSSLSSQARQREPLKRSDSNSSLNSILSQVSATEGRDENRNPESICSLDSCGTTLLEKALNFRQEYPEKWEEKQQTPEEKFDYDTFLDSYYERHDQILEEERELEEQRKKENPNLLMRLIFNCPSEHTKKNSVSGGSYSCSSSNVCIFRPEDKDFDVYQQDIEEEDENDRGDLVISIVEGNYLLNKLESNQKKYDSTSVQCKFFAYNSLHKQKHRTGEVYVNRKGSTKWNHKFVLKGFTEKQLEKSYVVLNVFGRKGDTKELIGTLGLSGKKATIWMEGSNHARGTTEEETKEWNQVLTHPGAIVEVTRDLMHFKEEHVEGITTTILQRKDLYRMYRNRFNKNTTSSPRKSNFRLKNIMKRTFRWSLPH